MENLKLCQICLITDVKMYDLLSSPLNFYIGDIIGVNAVNIEHLSPYACYECAQLLKKYYFFRQKCLRSQSIIFDLINLNGKISVEEIKKSNLQVSSSLTKILITEDNIIIYEHDSKVKKELVNVKEESLDDYQDFGQSFAGVSSDDDEPLSHHQDKKKQIELVVDVKECSSEDSDAAQITKESKPVEKKKKPVTSKKRGRPKNPYVQKSDKKNIKTAGEGPFFTPEEYDLEQFCTIITLTEEEQLEEITKRKTSSNYLNSPYQCNLCFKGFINTDTWEHHRAKHAPEAGDIKCGICHFRYKTKRSLQKHASNHEKKYACKSCSYISTNTTQAKQHQRWHKGVTYKCEHCDEVFTKWTSYMSHVRIKHPSEFICGICGYSFISKLGLTMHKTMMHKDHVEKTEEGEEAGQYCQECDVKFVSEEAWKRHMVMSTKHTVSDAINGCRTCGETFSNNEDLRLHHRRMHARKRPKNYGKKPPNTAWPTNCEQCSEEIPNAREYWTHFRRMHPDKTYPIQKNYICDVCGKSFRANAFLVYHKRTHSEVRAYKCGQCGKAFHNRTNLQVHEKTHSETRPYPCSVCFKAFKCKGALNRHFRCHTGAKPYECEVCGKTFSQSNSRKIHVKTVHLKQPAPYVSRSRLDRRSKPQPKNEPDSEHAYVY